MTCATVKLWKEKEERKKKERRKKKKKDWQKNNKCAWNVRL